MVSHERGTPVWFRMIEVPLYGGGSYPKPLLAARRLLRERLCVRPLFSPVYGERVTSNARVCDGRADSIRPYVICTFHLRDTKGEGVRPNFAPADSWYVTTSNPRVSDANMAHII